jgi:hypothetical protein
MWCIVCCDPAACVAFIESANLRALDDGRAVRVPPVSVEGARHEVAVVAVGPAREGSDAVEDREAVLQISDVATEVVERVGVGHGFPPLSRRPRTGAPLKSWA